MIFDLHKHKGTLNDGKILMVINDSTRGKYYSYFFSQEGIETDVVYLASAAMEKVKDEDYDIIVIEDYLSDGSGYVLTTQILKEKFSMIFMMGESLSDVDIIGAYKTGIADYVTYNVPVMLFVAKCKSAINFSRTMRKTKKACEEDGLITISGLTLNTRNGEVRKQNGQKIMLMRRESDVLRVLMEHAGREMTKKEIYEEAWKMPYIEGENSVANHVSKIRKKIEEDESNPQFIETRWGFGYSFKCAGNA